MRGFYKETLFVWFKTKKPVLRETNGYHAIRSKNVLIAGHEFAKCVQPPEHKGFLLAKIDKKQKDRKLSRSYVVIK